MSIRDFIKTELAGLLEQLSASTPPPARTAISAILTLMIQIGSFAVGANLIEVLTGE